MTAWIEFDMNMPAFIEQMDAEQAEAERQAYWERERRTYRATCMVCGGSTHDTEQGLRNRGWRLTRNGSTCGGCKDFGGSRA